MKLTYPLLLNAKPQAKPYKLTDRDSMYLYVSITGTKTWKFDYRLDDKACTYTLGRFPDLSLHDARELRGNAAKLVGAGIRVARCDVEGARLGISDMGHSRRTHDDGTSACRAAEHPSN
ncbi:hypothetical protein P3T23_003627 [Paraburkholderia sp. GAS448]